MRCMRKVVRKISKFRREEFRLSFPLRGRAKFSLKPRAFRARNRLALFRAFARDSRKNRGTCHREIPTHNARSGITDFAINPLSPFVFLENSAANVALASAFSLDIVRYFPRDKNFALALVVRESNDLRDGIFH